MKHSIHGIQVLLCVLICDASITTNVKVPTLDVISHPLKVNCTVPVCSGPLSSIYCHGEIISNSWQFGLQTLCPGPKLRFPPDTVVKNFKKLTYPMRKSEFYRFCLENFESIHYLEASKLSDWKRNPEFLNDLTIPSHRQLAEEIHRRWSNLSRLFTSDVWKHPDRYPVLPLYYPFIVPGGRFDIYFYWDSYWIVKGLLVSKMFETAKGIIENFSTIISLHGFIPNSGSIETSMRSQPPLFSWMINDYISATGDIESLKEWIPSVIKEIKFWENQRSVQFESSDGIMRTFFRYKAPSDCPRPENFLGDYNAGMKSLDSKGTWKSIASACESGWDFSSRWYKDGNDKNHQEMATDTIIPVDLNVYIAIGYNHVAHFYKIVKNLSASNAFERKGTDLANSINSLMWNVSVGSWFDYDLQRQLHRTHFYPSNVFPLMIEQNSKYSYAINNYLKTIPEALKYASGVPTSLFVGSGEQWDFPNVWAPMQHFFIISLNTTKNLELMSIAQQQALSFIEAVYNGLFKSKLTGLWEKYDARSNSGDAGSGGEYIVQEGFGWTNGAVLDLIWNYRHAMHLRSRASMEQFAFTSFNLTVVFLVVLMLIIALSFSIYTIIQCYGKKRNEVVENESSRLLMDTSDDDWNEQS